MKNVTFIVLLWGLFLTFPTVLTQQDPRATNPSEQLLPPSTNYWLGTDYLGRDVWSRVVWGGQRSVSIAVLGTFISMSCGLLLAILSVSESIWINRIIYGSLDAILAFPYLLMALVIVTLAGTGAFSVALASGVGQIAPVAVYLRTVVKQVTVSDYVEASQSMGASPSHIIRWHILRGIRSHLGTYGGLTFVYVFMNSSALSFLGFGGDMSHPDWGIMLADGRFSFRIAPWVAVFPGLAIALLVFSVMRISERLGSD